MDPSKAKYRTKKERIRLLSPIREVSGVIPVHVIPKGTKVMKGAGGHAPILVQSLPPEVQHPKPKMQPSERNYTNVDQVVADYLHYAKYGQVMPVLNGDAYGMGSAGGGFGLSCACCADRNRESVQRKLALQRGEDPNSFRVDSPAKDLPEHHGKKSDTQEQELPHDGQSMGGASPPHARVNHMSPGHAQQRWQYYQPTPYTDTYLNPEFNRPFVRQTAEEDSGTRREAAQHAYINNRIMEASSKYDHNMQKLQSHIKDNFVLPQGAIYLGKDKEDTFD